MDIAIVLLAAGQGTRMKSEQPKVLHQVCGRPMVEYIVSAAETLKPKQFVAVVSPASAEQVSAALPRSAETVIQEDALGTGDAVRCALPLLKDFGGTIVILCGDTPLVTGDTLTDLVKKHKEREAAATVLTAKVDDATGYGRIIRGDGGVKRIVEHRDATEMELHIREVNTGTYCFDAAKLAAALQEITPANSQKEYYLTDVIGIFFDHREKVVPFQVEDSLETMGVNSRAQLADAEMIMQERINRAHMANGVTMIHPALTYIDAGVTIGSDTVIHPNTFINGATVVGSGCLLGPSTRVVESEVGDGCEITFSVVREASLADGVTVGPFANVRPGTKVGTKGKIGSFVETKKATIGAGSKVPHLAYIGDAEIGSDVNIGAGTITCNFDGTAKHKTTIGNGAFIGSDTILVAPVKVGKRAYTGAGSTITKDVPDDSLGVERTDQRVIKNWRKREEPGA